MAPKNPTDKKASDALREASTRAEGHQPPLAEAQAEQAVHLNPETGAPASGLTTATPYKFEPATEAEVCLQMNEQQRRLLHADQLFQEFCRSNGWARPVINQADIERLQTIHRRPYNEILRLQAEARAALTRAGSAGEVSIRQQAGASAAGLNPEAKDFQPGQ
ncbi:MAG: hypothetical protein Q9195_004576 [Heterodermia aff. obscurata]